MALQITSTSKMDKTSWEQRLNAVTHILTSPTTSPPLHSQLFMATQIPCYLNWDYPPLLCRRPATLLRWAFSRFLERASRFGHPRTSWRCKCPYQIPPAAVLARGVEEARWGEEERMKYAAERLRRRRVGSHVHPLIPILLPNLLLLSLLLWDPFRSDEG